MPAPKPDAFDILSSGMSSGIESNSEASLRAALPRRELGLKRTNQHITTKRMIEICPVLIMLSPLCPHYVHTVTFSISDYKSTIRIRPQALAKQTVPKSTKVFDLRSSWVSFGHPLALIWMVLRWLALSWSSSNSHASQRKFFTVWPPTASRHKLIAS